MESIMSSKLFTTRRGTVILGVTAAALAAIALLVYLNHYRNSVNGGSAPFSVLVAKSLIQKGTPGDVIGSSALYERVNLPKNQVKDGAYVDPKTLEGKVAVDNIFPNQQLTAADFAVGTGNALTQQLARNQRAVVVSLDSPSEVGGQITPGDHVDVWIATNSSGSNGVSRPEVRMIQQNMYVMNAGANGGNVTVRATPQQAGELIYASQNAKIWLVLRPAVGSTSTRPTVITSNDLLGG